MGYPWSNGQVLTAPDLNAEFASILLASSPGGIFWVDSQAYGGGIQAAINAAATAGGGLVWLGPHDYSPTNTITCDLSKGVSITGFGPVTRLLCQGIAANNPVFSFTNGAEAMIPLSNMQLCAFNAGKSNAPINTGGAGHTDFVTNSQAIKFDTTAFSSVRNVQMWNFDRTTVWGPTGSIFSIDFDNCAFGGCNKGFCIDGTIPTNSFERMTVRRSSLSGCNYGAYIVTPDIGASFWIENCSLDFNAIREVYYQGSTGNTQLQSLHVSRNHMETSDACSGTSVSRSFCQGTIIFSENHFFENGPSGPPGFVDLLASSISVAKFNGNSQSSPNNVPYALTTGGQAYVGGAGNTTQQPQEVILSRSGDGDVAGESFPSDQYLFTTNGFVPHSDLEAQRRVHYLNQSQTGAGTSGSPYIWNLDPDSSTKHAIGTIIRLYNLGTGVFWQVVPGSGVTLTLDTGLAAPTINPFSVAGTKIELIKVAANSWRMHQV